MKNMKFFAFSFVLIMLNIKAQSLTTVQFFLSGQAMVNFVSQAPDGHALDQDAVELYKLMNVPPQNSLIGPGKAIVSHEKDLNFTCGTPPGRGPTCSIIFKNSSRVKMNPASKSVTFHAVGADAHVLSQLFVTNGGKLEFLSTDQIFKLEVSDQDVILTATGN